MLKKLICATLLCAAAIVSTAAPTSARPRETICTGDGPITTCCGPCGCCTWFGDGNGPVCKSTC